jgi:hypothetical protein
MSIILAIWKMEIGRIMIPGLPRGKKFVRSHLNRKELAVMACSYHTNNSWKCNLGEAWSMPAWAKNKTLPPK